MMKKRKISALVALIAGGSLALAGCSAPGAGLENGGGSEETSSGGALADMDPITISLADIDPDGSINGRAMLGFAEEVEEKTDGKISFETYFSGSLMPGNEMLTGIGTGTAGMGRLIASYFPSELPVANWVLGLGSSSSQSFPHGMLQGSISTHEAYMTVDELKDELASHNVTPLFGMVPSQQYDMLCTQPVESAAQAEGLRARTLGEPWVGEVESIGMTAVPLPVNEMYEGLQRGVVDCAVLQVPSHIDYSLWDVAQHYVPVSMSQLNGIIFVINTDIWNGLPAEAQDIIRDAAHNAWMTYLTGGLERYGQFADEGTSQHGLVFGDPRELDPLISAQQQSVVDALVDSAPANVADPAGLIQGYLDTQEKWLTVLTDDLNLPLSERDAESILESYAAAPGLDLSGFAKATKREGFDPYKSN